jgi:hypothetical protein
MLYRRFIPFEPKDVHKLPDEMGVPDVGQKAKFVD